MLHCFFSSLSTYNSFPSFSASTNLSSIFVSDLNTSPVLYLALCFLPIPGATTDPIGGQMLGPYLSRKDTLNLTAVSSF